MVSENDSLESFSKLISVIFLNHICFLISSSVKRIILANNFFKKISKNYVSRIILAFWYKELMIASKPWSEVMLLMILPMMWLRRRIWSVINHVTRFARDFNLTMSQRRAYKQLTHSLALQHTHTAKCYSFTVNIKSELL